MRSARRRSRTPGATVPRSSPMTSGARSLALEREDGQEIVGRIPDVRAIPGGRATGDPEQPEQAHDVVDAHPSRVAEPGPHRLDERPVPRGAEPVRHERRQTPVLPLEREVVGRRPHRDTLGQHVLPCPGVGALAVEADGEVGHQAERPPGASQLLVEQPLDPRVKRDPLPLLGGEPRRPRATRDAGAPRASAATPSRDARRARRRPRTPRGPGPLARGSARTRARPLRRASTARRGPPSSAGTRRPDRSGARR